MLLLAFAAAGLPAQSLELYSEFQRVDPFGNIVKSDRAESPREVLSPAVARNGSASFHVVVSVPPRMSYFLYVVTNPVNACRVALYKERFTKTKDGWVPDALSEVRRLPDFGVVPDPDEQIPEQTARVYLLDVWIPPDAEVARFRLEVQLKVGYFLVRPLEIRVTPARVPGNSILASRGTAETVSLPRLEEPADASAAGVLAGYIGGKPEMPEAHPLTVRGMIRRNAIQDMGIAATLDRSQAGPDAIRKRRDESQAMAGPPESLGAEWYLRIRDWLYAEVQK
ncbi:MAG TPA: hypothetical protein VNY05_36075 [Candidatus Acidoferrales bacterium]|nr:hypothetical protein [Candidatus Acidoferrales bacterium]